MSFGIEIVGDGTGASWRGSDRPARGISALARRLDSAGVSYWVIGADRDETAAASSVTLDASLVATVAARHSSRLGLVVAAAAHRDHPYTLSRRLLSVDHAAHGRVGWFALDADRRIALNAATDTWTDAVLDRVHTADAIEAVRALWRTWPLESVVGDHATGVFADINQIRRADVANSYAITGPMNVPGSVQGDLPVWRIAGADIRGADLVVIEDGEPVPDSATVVRVRATDRLGATLDRLAGTPGVVGVLVRVTAAQLDVVLDHVLPAARARQVVGGPGAGTLRHQLGLSVPAEPDVTSNAVAFVGIPNPGGRL